MTTTTLTKKQKLQAAYDLYRLRLEGRRREVEEAVRHTLKGLVELVNESLSSSTRLRLSGRSRRRAATG